MTLLMLHVWNVSAMSLTLHCFVLQLYLLDCCQSLVKISLALTLKVFWKLKSKWTEALHVLLKPLNSKKKKYVIKTQKQPLRKNQYNHNTNNRGEISQSGRTLYLMRGSLQESVFQHVREGYCKIFANVTS